MKVFDIYKKLLKYYGPQGWWPIFDKTSQKCIYSECRTSDVLHSFEICVGAILTQNTAWKNVEKALCNLYSDPTSYSSTSSVPEVGSPIVSTVFPIISAKAGISPKFILSRKNLEKLIQPAGYYNQKAKKLRIFSEWWQQSVSPKTKRPLSFWGNQKTLEARKELLSLWGIGPETADSILLYAFNKPIFVIDAYTKRLCKECGVKFKEYDEYQQFFESQLPPPAGGSAKLFNEYHALIVAWGKLHAKDKQSAIKIII